MVVVTPNCPAGIDTINASGTGGSAPTVITRSSGVTIVFVTVTPGNTDVELPSGAELADVVEVIATGADIYIYPPSGESMNGGYPYSMASGYNPRRYRKVGAALWIVY
jgi:hypothetical protein